MTFTIHASTNPETAGRGTCFSVSVPPPHERALTPATVMFDTFSVRSAITASLQGLCHLVECTDTDEGCFLTFETAHAELIVALPMSVAALTNAMALLNDERADDAPPHGITRPTLVPDE